MAPKAAKAARLTLQPVIVTVLLHLQLFSLMPKHGFKLPREVVEAVRRHVRTAIESVDPSRFRQEPIYTAALATRLEGVAYDGPLGLVSFSSTVADSIGPGTAESVYGADLAITATITNGRQSVRKAIVVQAKLGRIADLNAADAKFLHEQIEKMKKLVDAPKVMQIPDTNGRRHPQMVSGNHVLDGKQYTPMDLEDYFVARVTTTLDGCTDRDVVERVQNSSFTRVDVLAKLAENT